MVYSRQTQLFWRSMQPLVHKVVGDALTRCGLRPVVRDAVLHSRCANPKTLTLTIAPTLALPLTLTLTR